MITAQLPIDTHCLPPTLQSERLSKAMQLFTCCLRAASIYPARAIQKDIEAVVTNPRLKQVPIRAEIHSDYNGYFPKPYVISVAPSLAFSQGVDVVVGLKQSST